MNKKSNSKSIQNLTVVSSFFGYLGIFIGFISQTFFAFKYLEVEQQGLFGVFHAIAYPLSIIATLGIQGAANRFFIYFKDDGKKHNGFLKFSFLSATIGYLIVIFFVLIFKEPIIVYFSKTEENKLFAEYFHYLLPLVGAILYFTVFENYAKLLKDVIWSTFLNSFFQRFLNLLFLILFVYGFLNFASYTLFWLISFLILPILLSLRIVYLKEFFLLNAQINIPSEIKKDYFRFSAVTLLTSISSQIVFQIDKVMLAGDKNGGLFDAGIFNFAFLFGTVIAFPSAALVKSSTAFVAESWKNNDLAEINRLYKNSCIIQFLVGVLIFLGIICNMPNIFAIMPKYAGAGMILFLVGVTKLVDMATGINGLIISTSRYFYFDTVTFLCLTIITIALNYWLIPLYGVNGAGLAALLTMITYNVSRSLFLYLKFGFQPYNFNFIVVILIASGIFFLNTQIPVFHQNSAFLAFDIILRSLIIGFLFISLIYITGVSPETNGFLRNGIKKGLSLIQK